ncbi:hypothetical protein MPTK1_7g12270 [Marchantia polymorpha subsp. ruderalis]|uniref:Uncharacterized protein n=2 Tax=Marchantia polymorpha TaxID=3197 RepID=A0AAF6BYQ1_MARPO|nr:hypothetical protein MARPO_0889s0001 [Marchantia polymorpha]BBN17135.1 hypothetical protein Mp_7g12270 [Marchantia polymorpha subsp. ruderalis]|eukprot:PTQ26596.1 hypothetical protein MARPO_0889s0001 [Marchantia polymorpha]
MAWPVALDGRGVRVSPQHALAPSWPMEIRSRSNSCATNRGFRCQTREKKIVDCHSSDHPGPLVQPASQPRSQPRGRGFGFHFGALVLFSFAGELSLPAIQIWSRKLHVPRSNDTTLIVICPTDADHAMA